MPAATCTAATATAAIDAAAATQGA